MVWMMNILKENMMENMMQNKLTDKEKIELREKQWELAMMGNVQMLIWLGKQYLGQSDKVDSNWENPIDGVVFIDEDGEKYLDV